MPTKFAADVVSRLAELLDEIVPQGFVVVASSGVLEVRTDDDGVWTQFDLSAIIDQSADLVANVHSAAMCALSGVQDVVSETSGEPWPADPARGPRSMAKCEVRIDDRRASLWYGDADHVVIEVGIIDLAALG